MSEHAETLKVMLQDIINDRQEQAAVTMHDYFVAKSREVAGIVPPTVEDTTDTDDTNDTPPADEPPDDE
jgi:hypothetical protein